MLPANTGDDSPPDEDMTGDDAVETFENEDMTGDDAVEKFENDDMTGHDEMENGMVHNDVVLGPNRLPKTPDR